MIQTLDLNNVNLEVQSRTVGELSSVVFQVDSIEDPNELISMLNDSKSNLGNNSFAFELNVKNINEEHLFAVLDVLKTFDSSLKVFRIRIPDNFHSAQNLAARLIDLIDHSGLDILDVTGDSRKVKRLTNMFVSKGDSTFGENRFLRMISINIDNFTDIDFNNVKFNVLSINTASLHGFVNFMNNLSTSNLNQISLPGFTMSQITEYIGDNYSDLIRIDGSLEVKCKDNILRLEFSSEGVKMTTLPTFF